MNRPDPREVVAMVRRELKLEDDVLVLGADIEDYRTHRTSTGILSLDVALGGGLPLNQWTEILGHESCLAPDTFVKYQTRRPDGFIQNHKGGTIKRLYERFHGLRRGYRYERVKDSEYWAPSINDEGRVVMNRIEDVVSTGERRVFEVETKLGHKIQATAEHKFFVGSGYKELGDLEPGSTVFVHNGTRFKVGDTTEVEDRKYRKMLFVKHHGVAGVKEVKEPTSGKIYRYHRLANYRAVMEAHLNGLDFETYIARLNEGDLDGLEFLPRDVHVHHLDEDFTNDELSNLVLISPQEHGREHATKRHNNLRFMAVPDEIVSITDVGVVPTYDIKMRAPYNNYVANNFVVHNSGKTALTLKIIAAQQARDPEWVCLWVAAEELEEEYAEALGCDLDRFIIVESNEMEKVYDILLELADRRAFDGVVIDSLPALIPTGEYEGSMEDQQMALAARLNGKFYRKMGKSGRRSLIDREDRPWLGIVINQWRSKVGVVFGDPRTTPGGVAKNYAFYVRIETKRDEFIDNGLPKKNPQFQRVGQTIVARVFKNKSGPPEREASFDFFFAPYEEFDLGDIDRVKDVFNTATTLNILEREGNSYYFQGTKVGSNRPQTIAALEDNPEILTSISKEVTAHLDRRASRDPKKATAKKATKKQVRRKK